MSEISRLEIGDRVRVKTVDPAGHTRAPRYVRGHIGTVVEHHGEFTLPDDVVAGNKEPRKQPVYAVSFTAFDLWGSGNHNIIVDCWHAYLDPPTALEELND